MPPTVSQVGDPAGPVDPDLVRRLLLDQHPDLADRPLHTVRDGTGRSEHGVALVRVGQHFAVRLPRTAAGAARLERQTRALRDIAARTGADAGTRTGSGKGVRPGAGIAVPYPVRPGDPTGYFPWGWSVHRWIPGRPATGQAVRARAWWATRLARFAADLHACAPGQEASGEVAEGGLLSDHDAVVRGRLADAGVVEALDGQDRAQQVLRLWEQLLGAAPSTTAWAPWVHGRLDPARLLVDRGRLVGITGFEGPGPDGPGPGDPAADLAAGWLCFELQGRVEFVVGYSRLTGADDGWWLRGRAWAIVAALRTLAAVQPGEDGREGRHAIGQLLDAPDALRFNKY